MAIPRKKFASQMEEHLLEAVKEIARKDGRLFQAVLEDAVKMYIEAAESQKPRELVMTHFRASLDKNRQLGKLLAQ